MSLETMTKLGTVTVGAGGTSTITFSNIPNTYTDLVVKLSSRQNLAQIYGVLNIQFNNIGGTAYSYRVLQGSGSSAATSTNQLNVDSIYGVYSDNGANSTANTFSNIELYIPNYTSNTFKSVSLDQVSENNATTAYAILNAGIWANTSAINSITFATGGSGASFVQHSTATLYGIKNFRQSIPSRKPIVVGGTLTSDSQYYYRTFTSSGTLSISGGSLDADVLVIAGGGAGGASVASGYYGGGGGAGGVLLHNTKSLTGNQTVLIGAGGAYPLANRRGLKGGDSVFGTCTPSIGGGGGGGGSDQFDLIYSEQNGGPGGSGGGGQSAANATYSVPRGAGGSGTTGQGNNGGQGGGVFAVEPQAGGGGGGAGGAGGDASAATPGGAGGSGTAAYTTWGLATGTGQLSGGVYYYAGGGGGASNGTGGAAGVGGGGAGGGAAGADGTANTGGGAGNGRVGGSGLVIVRYTKTQVD